jgi:hypothetical protein
LLDDKAEDITAFLWGGNDERNALLDFLIRLWSVFNFYDNVSNPGGGKGDGAKRACAENLGETLRRSEPSEGRLAADL